MPFLYWLAMYKIKQWCGTVRIKEGLFLVYKKDEHKQTGIKKKSLQTVGRQLSLGNEAQSSHWTGPKMHFP